MSRLVKVSYKKVETKMVCVLLKNIYGPKFEISRIYKNLDLNFTFKLWLQHMQAPMTKSIRPKPNPWVSVPIAKPYQFF